MTSDELSSNPGPSLRPWVKAVTVCLAVLALLALFAQLRSHTKTHPAASAASTAGAPNGLTVPTGSYQITPQPPRPVASSLIVLNPQTGRLAVQPSAVPFVRATLEGIAAKSLRGARLLIGGRHPTEVGGNPHQFDKVPVHANESVAGILAMPGGDVVEVERYDGSGPSATLTAYWVSQSGSTHLIVNTDDVLPAFSGDAIWAYTREPVDMSEASGRVGHLLEVTLSGHLLASHVLADDLVPLADTAEGLVFSDGNAGKIEIRDRHTLAVRRTVAKAAFVAFVDNGWLVSETDPLCLTQCRLSVQNIVSGKSYVVDLADDLRPGEVVLNPVASTLAISYLNKQGPGDVVIADLATGAQEQIPGVVSETAQPATIDWTSDGKVLAVSVSSSVTSLRRIALWPGNGGPLEVLPGSYPGGDAPWSLTAL